MSFRRATLALVTIALVASFTASAHAEPYPVDSPEWTAAVQASSAHWGGMPCGGAVEFGWTALPYGVMGYASWMRSSEDPADTSRFTDCRVELNPEMDLGAELFCTALAHELGHLHGHDHVDDPNDVMHASIGEPLAACVTAMAPLQPTVKATAVPVAAPAKARAARPKKSSKRRRHAKAGRHAKRTSGRASRRA